ncbi:dTDP-4-dehydrorhamnose 3,5-epimerase [Marinicauda salina]|uniref:dTDP-4-dehydrorhamnose 3,5-epimerase n=2 Tax=Marinicauda salina TaxID=2135793 RepID=A0A2U2BYC3_9PROT|nr:dTDP-4-dehydrorhamnose 3,5-epimerase [Marinicauda salina]
MNVDCLDIPDVKVVAPARFSDERGFFSEAYNERSFAAAGVDARFVQDNHSYSASVGTVRGLHFQSPPYAQAKLVRVAVGRIFDVAVDIRRGSPTFGHSVAVELSADTGNQLFIPAGFLHAFMTLEPDTHVLYKVDAFYSREHDGSVRFDDPDLAIDWPLPAEEAVLSKKDAAAPSWAEFESPFQYER